MLRPPNAGPWKGANSIGPFIDRARAGRSLIRFTLVNSVNPYRLQAEGQRPSVVRLPSVRPRTGLCITMGNAWQ